MTGRAGFKSFVLLTLILTVPAAFSQAPGQPYPPQPYPDQQYGAQQQYGAPQYPADQQPTAQLMSPEQLDNLVAPVALYPDSLLGQVLAASTYPVEISQAQQWLQQNSGLQGAQLMEAARQQNWDPSVQAMVGFPQALNLLSGNIRWTTDLGNAFLSQQADVMSAIQRMRARAQANGRLQSNAQEVVSRDGQNDIQIEPANPQVVYVPTYDPAYVWGAGAYPELWYPGLAGYGFGFGPGIYIGSYFPGWGGWGSWGWGCGWRSRTVIVNHGFFNRYGFHNSWGRGGYAGRGNWVHDPGHRWSAPYTNRSVSARFNSGRVASRGFSGGSNNYRGFSNGYHGQAGNYRGGSVNGNMRGNFGNTGRAATVPSQGFRNSPYAGRSTAPGFSGSRYSTPRATAPSATPRSFGTPRTYSAPSRSYTPGQSYSAPRSFGTPGAGSSPRTFSAPRSYSAPRSFSAPSAPRSFSAPRSSAPSQSFGHSSGGFSGGGRSFSSGGHSSGGFSGGGRSSSGGGHSSGGFSGGGHSSGGHGGGGHRR